MSQVTAPSSTLNPPLRDTMAKPNCMNRIVQWFCDDETPTIRKVGALVLAALVFIGVGFATHPAVAAWLVVLLERWAISEWEDLRKQDETQQNCMNRIVQWFRDDETPTIRKVGALVLAALVLIGTGFATDPLLAGSLALLPALWALLEWEDLRKQDAIQQRALWDAEIVHALQEMKKTVGGEEMFDRLPLLDIQERRPLDLLHPRDLNAPVMRGVAFDRPFFAIKVKDAEAGGQLRVFTFFQKVKDRGEWVHAHSQKQLFGSIIEEKDRTMIHQIVVLKNHPRFTLAE